jgi:p-cumate 2,3-dioxygenase beta subunit
MSAAALSITRAQVEDFLFAEAALLDDWNLDGWLALFAPGAHYHVPPAGAPDDADPATTLFYIADDWHRLTERVKRLKKPTAFVEQPPSKCRRMVSNVRILGGSDERFEVTSNYVTFRSKLGETQSFFGHHRYALANTTGGLRILAKTSFIDADHIRDQNKVSIIL